MPMSIITELCPLTEYFLLRTSAIGPRTTPPFKKKNLEVLNITPKTKQLHKKITNYKFHTHTHAQHTNIYPICVKPSQPSKQVLVTHLF